MPERLPEGVIPTQEKRSGGNAAEVSKSCVCQIVDEERELGSRDPRRGGFAPGWALRFAHGAVPWKRRRPRGLVGAEAGSCLLTGHPTLYPMGYGCQVPFTDWLYFFALTN